MCLEVGFKYNEIESELGQEEGMSGHLFKGPKDVKAAFKNKSQG